MLKTTKTRSLVGNFYADKDGVKTLVKSTIINIDSKAVSSIVEQMIDSTLYSDNRTEMRKDENKLSEMRYAIEDQIIAEAEAESEAEAEAEAETKAKSEVGSATEKETAVGSE